MTPKHVTERQDDTGHELGGEAGKADASGLESGGVVPSNSSGSSNAISQSDKPPEEIVLRDPSDIISEEILSHAPLLMQRHLQMLQEQYESTMQMHRHYKEIAVNGTEADIGPTSADDMALSYLRQASQISQNISTMVNEMLRTSTKKTLEREKLRGRAKDTRVPEGAVLTQNNMVINFDNANHRTKLRMMDEMTGGKKLDGSLGIPNAKSLISSITNTGDDENNEEEPDAQ